MFRVKCCWVHWNNTALRVYSPASLVVEAGLVVPVLVVETGLTVAAVVVVETGVTVSLGFVVSECATLV